MDRIRESGESPEEYMLLLEKQNRALEEDRERLLAAEQQIEQMKGCVAALEEAKHRLNARLATSERTLVETLERHEREVAAMKEAHAAECDSILGAHREETEALEAAYRAEISQKDDTLRARCAAFDAERRALCDAHTAKLLEAEQQWRHRLDGVQKELTETESERVLLASALQAATAEKELANGRFMALSLANGGDALRADYTDKAGFEELEHQFEAFQRFFKEEWKKARSAIRKNTFAAFRSAIKSGKSKEFLESDTPDAAFAVVDTAAVSDAADGNSEAAEQHGEAKLSAEMATADKAAGAVQMINEENKENESEE